MQAASKRKNNNKTATMQPARRSSPPTLCRLLLLSLAIGCFCVAVTQSAPQNTTTVSTPATTIAPATTEVDEDLTSTTDSLGVSGDETEKLDSDESPTEVKETAGSSTTTTTTTPDIEEAAGIEPKSINGARPDANDFESEPAKLSVDSSAPGTSTAAPDDGPSTTDKPGRKPRTRLNMTLIDQIFLEGRKDEQQVAEIWRGMNKKLKKGISTIIGAMVPAALNMTQEARISGSCSGAMLKWILSMNQLKAWALHMLDASGKPAAGALQGALTMFGNYEECLKVRAPDDDEIEFTGEFREQFRGKYCVIQAKPWLPKKDQFYTLNAKIKTLMEPPPGEDAYEPTPVYDQTIFEEFNEWLLAFNYVSIRFDICVPSMCSREDIQRVVNYLLKSLDFKARVSRCEVDPYNKGPFGAMSAQVETGEEEVDQALLAAVVAAATTDETTGRIEIIARAVNQLGWLLLPLLAASIVLLASFLSLLISRSKRVKGSGIGRAIRSLSLKRSVKSHLRVDYDQLADDKPLALYGLRFVLVLWVIMVESTVNLKFEFLRELLVLKPLIFWRPAQVIINSTLQFDTFILLTAFTMGYKLCLNEGTSNPKSITRFVLEKYIRLMPSVMLMVALTIIWPLTFRGAVWTDYVTKQSAICQSNGWLNVLFLQNYLPYNKMCLPQTWLLCVEMQLVIIMAPIVYYLNKSYTSNYNGSGVSEKSLMDQMKNVGDRGLDNDAVHRSNVNGNQYRHQQNNKSFLSLASNRSTDSSKLFHWIWTVPGSILAACVTLGLGCRFYNVYFNQLPPTWFYTMADPDSRSRYFSQHMTKLWTHLAVFSMGLLAGIECRRAARNVIFEYREPEQMMTKPTGPGVSGGGTSFSIDINTMPESKGGTAALDSRLEPAPRNSRRGCLRNLCSMLLNIMGLIIVITMMSIIIFAPYEWSVGDLPEPFIAAMYDAGSRFLWSLAFIWILYQVSVPDGDRKFSFFARLLGRPLMVSLGKLSFLIYIMYPFVQTTFLAIQEQPIYSSWFMLFHMIIGNITITVILASVVSLFVEMPCRNLFRRCGETLLLTNVIETTANAAGRTRVNGGQIGTGNRINDATTHTTT